MCHFLSLGYSCLSFFFCTNWIVLYYCCIYVILYTNIQDTRMKSIMLILSQVKKERKILIDHDIK